MVELLHAGSDKEVLHFSREGVFSALAEVLSRRGLSADLVTARFVFDDTGYNICGVNFYNPEETDELKALREEAGCADDLSWVKGRIDFQGIWPASCSCGHTVGSIKWPLGDSRTTDWVRRHVNVHRCRPDRSVGDATWVRPKPDHGPHPICSPDKDIIVVAFTNDRPVHMTCWLAEDSYDKLLERLRGET